MRISEMATVFNTVGLSFNIIGVIMLFFFGLPPKVAMQGLLRLDGADRRTKRRYARWSWVALAFLVIGFGLQLVSGLIE